MTTETEPLLTCAQLRALGRPQSELLERMEADLGADAVHRFVRLCGGEYLSLARIKASSETWLGENGCEDVATWLREHWGHGRLVVPMGPNSCSNRALARAVAIISKGGSNRDAVRAAGLHARQIEYILHRWREVGTDIFSLPQGADHDHQR